MRYVLVPASTDKYGGIVRLESKSKDTVAVT